MLRNDAGRPTAMLDRRAWLGMSGRPDWRGVPPGARPAGAGASVDRGNQRDSRSPA